MSVNEESCELARYGRIAFVRRLRAETEDGRSVTVLSRDLSVNGIRLVAPNSMLGKKLRVTIPMLELRDHVCFSVQIVWSKVVSGGVFENGAVFLEVASVARADALRRLTAPVLVCGSPRIL
jgi:hypothetical protein